MTGLYQNLIFDLDGTLTDSAPGVTKSVQYALKKFAIEVEAEQLKAFVGPPLQQSFQKYYGFSEADAFKAVSYYREYYSKFGIYENRLYPDIGNLIRNLKSVGKKLYVATSKPTIFAEKVLAHFEIDCFFSMIVGSNLDGTRVNKVEVLEYLFKHAHGMDLKRAVMIGDRKFDIIGAHAKKLDSIAVTYGYGSLEELSAEEPTKIVSSVSELQTFLLCLPEQSGNKS